MGARIETIVTECDSVEINRRAFFEWLIGAAWTYGLAHHVMETNALATSLLSPQESIVANVESRAIKYPGVGVTMEGYLSRPRGSGPFPAVIVIHEKQGLNDHSRDVARRLASQGYVALAADLLSRQGGASSFPAPDDANRAIQNLKDDDAARDLNATYNYLNSISAVKKNTIAVMRLERAWQLRQTRRGRTLGFGSWLCAGGCR